MASTTVTIAACLCESDNGKFTTVILGQQRDMCCPGTLAVAEAIVTTALRTITSLEPDRRKNLTMVF